MGENPNGEKAPQRELVWFAGCRTGEFCGSANGRKRPIAVIDLQEHSPAVNMERSMTGTFAYSLFQEEPGESLADGFVFVNAPELTDAEQDPRAGYWRCDIAHDNRLTWSEKVYALFGLPAGTPVTRAWAVARYTEPSKTVLEHVRMYALRRKLGFILDAAIKREGGGHRWIRVLAVPILSATDGRVVGVHGLKRPIEPLGRRGLPTIAET